MPGMCTIFVQCKSNGLIRDAEKKIIQSHSRCTISRKRPVRQTFHPLICCKRLNDFNQQRYERNPSETKKNQDPHPGICSSALCPCGAAHHLPLSPPGQLQVLLQRREALAVRAVDGALRFPDLQDYRTATSGTG